MMNEIGKRLKEVRVSLGLTQEGICEFIGIKQAQLSEYENGKKQISISVLSKLSDLYGVSIDYFVTGKGYEPQNITSLAFRAKKVSPKDTRAILWAKQMLETYISVITMSEKAANNE